MGSREAPGKRVDAVRVKAFRLIAASNAHRDLYLVVGELERAAIKFGESRERERGRLSKKGGDRG